MIPQVRPDQMSPMQLEMLAREFDGDVSPTIQSQRKCLTISVFKYRSSHVTRFISTTIKFKLYIPPSDCHVRLEDTESASLQSSATTTAATTTSSIAFTTRGSSDPTETFPRTARFVTASTTSTTSYGRSCRRR
jgi:hypothetical protein